MDYTFIKISILVFVFSTVVYAIVMQARRVISTKRRRIIAKNRKTIEDTADVLKHSSSLACSKMVEILLIERILTSVNAILKVEPGYEKLKQYAANQHLKIAAIKSATTNNTYIEPSSEREAINLARQISKLKKILREEHAKTHISTADCVAEEQKLERIRLKLRLGNTLNRARGFFEQEKFHTVQKMLQKLIETIEPLENKDVYIVENLEQANILFLKSTAKLDDIAQAIADRDKPEKMTSLDILFDEKQQ